MSDEQFEASSTDADIPPSPPLLEVDDLQVAFPRQSGAPNLAVDGVSFEVGEGEIIGIVGESGSGKSVTARAILQLVPSPGKITRGRVLLGGANMSEMSERSLRSIRGNDIALISQDPMTSLNPVLKIGTQIVEGMRAHRKIDRRSAWKKATELLDLTQIPEPAVRVHGYPHHLSGGMRQRATIAMAIANTARLLIADEPTTALDVTVQAQIVRLLKDLNEQSGVAIILITHDMGLVASLCSRVVVMYAGQVVEEGPIDRIFDDPQHPYTWSLLRSIPRIDHDAAEELPSIEGAPPAIGQIPSGCRFHPRCPFAVERCRQELPPVEALDASHSARCWIPMRNTKPTS